MEPLLLIVLLVGFIANILFMRFFFKRVSDKLTFLTHDEEQTQQTHPAAFTGGSLPFPPINASYRAPVDAAIPNQVGENEESLELSEQNLSALPKDVKFEVEGGDVHTPPGFAEAKN